jgi:hypothetical protein
MPSLRQTRAAVTYAGAVNRHAAEHGYCFVSVNA